MVLLLLLLLLPPPPQVQHEIQMAKKMGIDLSALSRTGDKVSVALVSLD